MKLRILIVTLALLGSGLAKPSMARRPEPVLVHTPSFTVDEWDCGYIGKYRPNGLSLYVCFDKIDGSWMVWTNGQ